jgi:hypothetical protein
MIPPLLVRIAAWLLVFLTPLAFLDALQIGYLPSELVGRQRIDGDRVSSSVVYSWQWQQERGRGTNCVFSTAFPRRQATRSCALHRSNSRATQNVTIMPSSTCRLADRPSETETKSLPASAPPPPPLNIEACQRRRRILLALASQLAAPIPLRAALAAPSSAPPVSASLQIQESIDALQALVDNWSTAVVDCTYADVPRELLETKNKAEILEKAKTSALFDKSASVVSCKTTNRIVREYLGSTGKGPLVGLDRALRKGLDQLDGDSVDEYVQLLEQVQNDLSKADSLSYTAGVTDLSSINNFDQGVEDAVLSSNSSLQEARGAIQAALSGLKRIVLLLS